MLIDLVKMNRSYRGYDHSRKVSRDELVKLVEAARLCPSSVNAQPLKYFLAYEEETVSVSRKKRNGRKRFRKWFCLIRARNRRRLL